ncbi:MAG: TetR/AcrR family transcriptional regulator [Acidimicrobiales bacterium]
MTRPRNRRGEGGRLRAELIDAAEALLVESDRPEHVSLRRIAAEVGVTAPAIYRHFPDKEALLEAVVARRFDEFRARFTEAYAQEDDCFDGLRRAAAAYLDFAAHHPAHYQVLFGPVTNPDVLGLRSEGRPHPGEASMAALVEQLQKCLDTGPGGRRLDAATLAVETWTLLHGNVELRHSRPGFPWPPADELIGGWIDRLRHMVQHPPASSVIPADQPVATATSSR